MKAVVQRVNYALLKVEGKEYSSIKKGLLILLGITSDDNSEDIKWMVNKLVQMRIFGDKEGKMNLSVQDINGEIMVVSQFTLHASTKKGNRPSFIQAAKPEIAIPLYNSFLQELGIKYTGKIATGSFGAMMQISFENDGPVTIIIDSKNRI